MVLDKERQRVRRRGYYRAHREQELSRAKSYYADHKAAMQKRARERYAWLAHCLTLCRQAPEPTPLE